MSLTRIRFSDSADGSSPYTVILNPGRMELNEGVKYNIVNTLDGSSVKQTAVFDGRPISLYWTTIPDDFTGFTGMLATLESYIDSQKYVNYGDADYRISPAATWNLVRVADVKISIPKGGQVRYNVELVLLPESS
jgi:hypothetical protein